jgi:high-affinity nickel permease
MLGLEHAFEPDHVVAVTTIVSNIKGVRKSLVLGTMWGLGHAITILIAGTIVLALRIMIPESMTRLFMIIAGIMLIVLGAFVIKELLTERAYSLNPKNGVRNLIIPQPKAVIKYDHAHKSLFSGIIQGLGGSAAIMLVTLSTVDSATMGMIFIALFGLGVILGMLSYGALIGGFIAFATLQTNKMHGAIKAITSCVSIGFGIYIIVNSAI